MPTPWKKVKSSKISQLVNDHLHISQKRRDGSSLVVETGFPTSLIDLFFKNREKLKKSSKKKRLNRPSSPSGNVCEPATVGSLISCSSPPPRHSSVPPPTCADEICGSGSSGGDAVAAAAEESGGYVNINGVFVGFLKVFVVVVLAFSTKRFAVGISISAALLLFLEYVERHHRLLSTPCAAAMSLLRSGGRFFSYKKLEQQDRSINDVSTSKIQPEKETITNSISKKNRVGHQEIELLEMAMKREESMRDATDSRRKSRKAKIKSKMQKMVPKKFRSSRKERKSHAENVDQSDIGEESENASISSSSSVSDWSYREEDNMSTIGPRLSDANDEAGAEIEDRGAAETPIARRCMLLCVIVLVGLIGGRPLALVLTLTWFLLLKVGHRLCL